MTRLALLWIAARLSVCACALLLTTAPALARDDVGRLLSGAPEGGDRPPAHEDVGQDRGFVHSRAETLGPGRLGIDVYELAVLGLSYGIGEDTQVAATWSPFVDLPVRGAAVHVKRVLLRNPHWILGIHASGGRYQEDGTRQWLLGGGAALDYLPNAIFSAHASLDLGLKIDGPVQRLGLLAQAELTGRFSELGQAMAEVLWLGPEALGSWKQAVLIWGVRLNGRGVCADLGLLRPLSLKSTSSWSLGVPWVGVSTAIGGKPARPGEGGASGARLPPSSVPFGD